MSGGDPGGSTVYYKKKDKHSDGNDGIIITFKQFSGLQSFPECQSIFLPIPISSQISLQKYNILMRNSSTNKNLYFLLLISSLFYNNKKL